MLHLQKKTSTSKYTLDNTRDATSTTQSANIESRTERHEHEQASQKLHVIHDISLWKKRCRNMKKNFFECGMIKCQQLFAEFYIYFFRRRYSSRLLLLSLTKFKSWEGGKVMLLTRLPLFCGLLNRQTFFSLFLLDNNAKFFSSRSGLFTQLWDLIFHLKATNSFERVSKKWKKKEFLRCWS